MVTMHDENGTFAGSGENGLDQEGPGAQGPASPETVEAVSGSQDPQGNEASTAPDGAPAMAGPVADVAADPGADPSAGAGVGQVAAPAVAQGAGPAAGPAVGAAAPVAQGAGAAVQQVPTSGLAIAGLVLGILAILGAFVPFLNIGALPFALVGLILAIVGLLGINKGKRTGRGIAIAGVVLGAVSLIVIVGMYGCAGLIASTSGSHSAASASGSAASASVSSGAASASAGTPAASKAERNGFDEATNSTITAAGMTFQLPSYFAAPSTSNSGSGGAGASNRFYAAEKNAGLTVLEASLNGSITSFTSEQIEAVKNTIGQLLDEGSTVSEASEVTVAGQPGVLVDGNGKLKGEDAAIQALYFVGPNNKAGVLAFITLASAEYDYRSDVDKIFASVAVADPAAGQGSADGVSPDVKEALDSYEAFMDEYIVFMQKYNSSDDVMSLLNDYSKYMQKYLDASKKIEAMDTSKMSAADKAYYIEVTTRVSQKLLEAAL